jgi:hypothetical protein
MKRGAAVAVRNASTIGRLEDNNLLSDYTPARPAALFFAAMQYHDGLRIMNRRKLPAEQKPK